MIKIEPSEGNDVGVQASYSFTDWELVYLVNALNGFLPRFAQQHAVQLMNGDMEEATRTQGQMQTMAEMLQQFRRDADGSPAVKEIEALMEQEQRKQQAAQPRIVLPGAGVPGMPQGGR